MRLVPFDTGTRVTWAHDRRCWSGLEFLERDGYEWIGRDEFRNACVRFVDAVVERLDSRNISGTLLQEEWAAIQSADKDEREFCETAAAIGWDPYEMDDLQRASVVRIGQTLSGAVFEEAVPVLHAEKIESELDAIVRVLSVGRANGTTLEHFTSIREELVRSVRPESHDRPWKVGYRLAKRARERLDLDGKPLASWRGLGEALREPGIAKGCVARSTAFDRVALVEGVIATGSSGLPAVAIPYGRSSMSRFRFCRGLADMLMSPETDTLLTKGHSSRQRRGRAFAAEFLTPSSALRARVDTQRGVLDEEDVEQMATEFGVSPWVIKHQLNNHRIARVEETACDQPAWSRLALNATRKRQRYAPKPNSTSAWSSPK